MEKTDWNLYYSHPNLSAGLSRKIVAAHLRKTLRPLIPERKISIAELGGGDSSFVRTLYSVFDPVRYAVFDSNENALARFRSRSFSASETHLCDLLSGVPDGIGKFDLVFSIGLIEHFTPEETARLIRLHFALAKPGGIVVLSFPTPTMLYRATRFCAEKLGLWRFPDERPLQFQEVRDSILPVGKILSRRLIRSNFLTQLLIAAERFRS